MINAGIIGNKSNRDMIMPPGFYYHTSSKEPIAVVKNIGIEQINNNNQ